ncbi:MAG: 50S ribosomal protein L7/L12 [Planctomycetes bacterium]|nr:50S ribosomal protein L7/L12 [Planctomycetota bacterium]
MTEVAEKVQKVLDEVAGWNLLEVRDFVKAFEEKFDVKAQAAAVAVAAPAGGGDAAPAAVEKTEFDVILEGVTDPAKKIPVIKVVREITALGLADAKKLVEEAPKPVKEGVPKEEAEAMKKKLDDAGGKTSLK